MCHARTNSSWCITCLRTHASLSPYGKDYVGADKHGRPLLIERVGAWDIQAVLDATEDLEKFTLLHAMADETLLQMKRPTTAKDPRGFVLIVDMEGHPGSTFN